MNIYQALFNNFKNLVVAFCKCIDVDSQYYIDKQTLSKIPSLLKSFEDVVKCFRGFQGEKEYKNALVLCQRMYDELINFSEKGNYLNELDFLLFYYPHLEGLLLICDYYFLKILNGEKPYKFAVIDHRSIFGVNLQIHYTDILAENRIRTVALHTGNSGYLVLATNKDSISVNVEYNISGYKEWTKLGDFTLFDLKDGFNLFNFGRDPRYSGADFKISGRDPDLDEIGEALGMEKGVLLR